MGLPGFIETPLKYVLKPSFFINSGIKSNFPADIAPEVTHISISDLIDFFQLLFKFALLIVFYNTAINYLIMQTFSE